MAQLDRNAVLRCTFTDKQHFPYGFSRSGDFSISESQRLQQYGCLFAALIDGQLSPQTEQDQEFLAAAHGDAPTDNPNYKAWIKYQTLINRPKTGSFYGRNKPQLEDDPHPEAQEDDLSLSLESDEQAINEE